MYEAFYGLRERPFDLSPNPRFLFASQRHTEALTHLRYGLTGRPGVTVLIGEAGTGKTTLVRAALQPADGSVVNEGIVYLSNPTLSRAEFYEYLAAGYGFSPQAGQSKPSFLAELEGALERRSEGRVIALIVDEAQSLPHELLEEVRLLTNLQTSSGSALTVVLVGQPELAVRLNEERLRQLKQRIALRCELAPFDLKETAAYIATRARVAGGRPEMLFTREAVLAIHEHSKGIPRTISVICDNALVNGFAADLKPVGKETIIDVCRDFDLSAPPPVAVKPAKRLPAPAIPLAEAPAAAPALVRNEMTAAEDRSMFAGFGRRKRFLIF